VVLALDVLAPGWPGDDRWLPTPSAGSFLQACAAEVAPLRVGVLAPPLLPPEATRSGPRSRSPCRRLRRAAPTAHAAFPGGTWSGVARRNGTGYGTGQGGQWRGRHLELPSTRSAQRPGRDFAVSRVRAASNLSGVML